MKELPVLTPPSDSPNCRPCPIGKALGRRTCPGVRARQGIARLLRKIGTFLSFRRR
jgi:hypothetical protein